MLLKKHPLLKRTPPLAASESLTVRHKTVQFPTETWKENMKERKANRI